jgi:hypothetical protein
VNPETTAFPVEQHLRPFDSSNHRLTKVFDTVRIMPVPQESLYCFEDRWINRLRPKLNGKIRVRQVVVRPVVSARVDNALYDTMTRHAETQDIKLSTLIEETLKEKFE